jgi:hypothetical protein
LYGGEGKNEVYMKETDTVTLKLTPQELNVLHEILQNMVKHPEVAEQVYATYQEDRALVKGLAVLVQEQIIEKGSVLKSETNDGRP